MYHALKALAHERLYELTLFWYHFFISLSFASLTPHEKIRNFFMVSLSVITVPRGTSVPLRGELKKCSALARAWRLFVIFWLDSAVGHFNMNT